MEDLRHKSFVNIENLKKSEQKRKYSQENNIYLIKSNEKLMERIDEVETEACAQIFELKWKMQEILKENASLKKKIQETTADEAQLHD